MRVSLRRAKNEYSKNTRTDEVAVRQAVAHAYQPSPEMAGVEVQFGLSSDIRILCQKDLAIDASKQRDRAVKPG